METTEKEEVFISEHPKSQLEIVATDYRPIAEIQYSKRSLENQEVNFEEFIAVKGIKAQGNQLTTEKIKQVSLLESLPFEEKQKEIPEEIEVINEVVIEDKLPIEVPKTLTEKPISEELSAAEKAKIALQKSIAKKKAEEKKRDDENQTKLF